MKNKLLSDINILNKEKNSILNEISRLKNNEQQNINIINSKDQENLKLRNEINNLNEFRDQYEKNKENTMNLE